VFNIVPVWVKPEPLVVITPTDFITVVSVSATEVMPSVALVLPNVIVPALGAAAMELEVDTMDKSPAPTTATVASAMRLRSVFVDIYFLSVSQIKTFLTWLGEFFRTFLISSFM